MSENTETKQSHGQETMVRGVAWLTAGSFISRLLGVIYIIIWYRWMGEHRAEANALFNMGYQVYANFLLLSTVGLPTAVAKQIAKYNIKGRSDISYYLVREFFKLMVILGVVFAAIMYLSSPLLAQMSGAKEELIPVMYSLVPPLFIFPTMSIMRGFFQGHHDMKPYAVSQIVEQIVRVIWILATTFFIMKLGSGDYKEAVVQSTFAAFIGMIASVGTLGYTMYRQGFVKKVFRPKPASVTIDLKGLILETVREAIPLIILGCAFQIFQLIDQMTFVNFMALITDQSKKSLLVLYSYMTANPSKITMLIIGVTGSLGSVAIPLITERFVQGDKKGTGKLIEDNLQMLFIFVIPAITGTVLLARPLYSSFYNLATNAEIQLFIANLLLIFIQGLYAIFGVVIPAIFENRAAIKYFFIGLAVKCILQLPALWLFHAYGSLLASAIGLTVTVYLFYKRIKQVVPIDEAHVKKDILTISWISLIMGVVIWLVEFGLVKILPLSGQFICAVHVAISGSAGIVVFVLLTLKTRQLDKLIGSRAKALRRKLKIS
ncbi:polysaccharide biosynthesis protein [Streptococcus gallolyticus]|nr:polysaccharide biosynthesis protein [Streptococcus gallolyticus]MBY5040089.1 polysaccharide biosynthesis protein [Streptococcus gallolyticus]